MQLNNETLEMALVGYQHKREQLIAKISEINQELGRHEGHNGQPPKRTISAAGRERIAAYQRKRWRKFHRLQRKAA